MKGKVKQIGLLRARIGQLEGRTRSFCKPVPLRPVSEPNVVALLRADPVAFPRDNYRIIFCERWCLPARALHRRPRCQGFFSCRFRDGRDDG